MQCFYHLLINNHQDKPPARCQGRKQACVCILLVQPQITHSTELSFSALLINYLSCHRVTTTQNEQPLTLLHSLSHAHYLLCLKDLLRWSPQMSLLQIPYTTALERVTERANSQRDFRSKCGSVASSLPHLCHRRNQQELQTSPTVLGQGWFLSLVSHLCLTLAATRNTHKALRTSCLMQLPPDTGSLNSECSALPYPYKSCDGQQKKPPANPSKILFQKGPRRGCTAALYHWSVNPFPTASSGSSTLSRP